MPVSGLLSNVIIAMILDEIEDLFQVCNRVEL